MDKIKNIALFVLKSTQTEGQIRRFTERGCNHEGIKFTETVYKQVLNELKNDSLTIQAMQETERLKVSNKQNKKLLDQYKKELLSRKDIVDKITQSVKAIKPIDKIYKYKKASKYKPEIAKLLLSDWHTGEVTQTEQITPTYFEMIDGVYKEVKTPKAFDSYNLDIVARRAEYLVEKTLELIYLQRNSVDIVGLVVDLLGDMLSGNIHAELIATNEKPIAPTVVWLAHILSYVFRDLSPHFPFIDVFCVPGNHSRVFAKPTNKQKALESWEYILGHLVKALTKDIKNVRVHVSEAPSMIINIYGWNYMLNHGDSIRGWAGIPYYGINRKTAQWQELMLKTGIKVDRFLLGHFHTPAKQGNWILNGSLKGGDDYSINQLALSSPATQIMFGVNEERPVTWSYNIDFEGVTDEPRRYKFED